MNSNIRDWVLNVCPVFPSRWRRCTLTSGAGTRYVCHVDLFVLCSAAIEADEFQHQGLGSECLSCVPQLLTQMYSDIGGLNLLCVSCTSLCSVFCSHWGRWIPISGTGFWMFVLCSPAVDADVLRHQGLGPAMCFMYIPWFCVLQPLREMNSYIRDWVLNVCPLFPNNWCRCTPVPGAWTCYVCHVYLFVLCSAAHWSRMYSNIGDWILACVSYEYISLCPVFLSQWGRRLMSWLTRCLFQATHVWTHHSPVVRAQYHRQCYLSVQLQPRNNSTLLSTITIL